MLWGHNASRFAVVALAAMVTACSTWEPPKLFGAADPPPAPEMPPPAPPPVQLSDDQIAEIIVRESKVEFYSTARRCACPDDKKPNGVRCGKRSAYTKSRGTSPKCSPKDVTPGDLAAYRARPPGPQPPPPPPPR